MAIAKLYLTIGGLALLIESPQKDFVKRLRDDYRNFLKPISLTPSFRLKLCYRQVKDYPEMSLVRHNGLYTLETEAFEGTIDLKRHQGRFAVIPNLFAFNSFLRIFYSLILLKSNGFLIHGAGLERGAKGYLFVGPSSSGKTTTARRAKGFRVLSDELTLVRKIKDRFYLFSTPFMGEFAKKPESISAALAKIFFLHKEKKDFFQKQGILDTTLHLLENVLFFAKDTGANQKILTLCSQLSSQLAGQRMNIMECESLRRFIDEDSPSYHSP